MGCCDGGALREGPGQATMSIGEENRCKNRWIAIEQNRSDGGGEEWISFEMEYGGGVCVGSHPRVNFLKHFLLNKRRTCTMHFFSTCTMYLFQTEMHVSVLEWGYGRFFFENFGGMGDRHRQEKFLRLGQAQIVGKTLRMKHSSIKIKILHNQNHQDSNILVILHKS